jgi:hypothetical protein
MAARKRPREGEEISGQGTDAGGSTLVDWVYHGVDSYAVARAGRRELEAQTGERYSSLAYGEVCVASWVEILTHSLPRCPAPPLFVDIGSGTGKAVLGAALSGLPLAGAIGVELVPQLHATQAAALRKLLHTLRQHAAVPYTATAAPTEPPPTPSLEWPAVAITAAAQAAVAAGHTTAHPDDDEDRESSSRGRQRRQQRHALALATWVETHVQLSCGDSFCGGGSGGGGSGGGGSGGGSGCSGGGDQAAKERLPEWLQRASDPVQTAPTLLYAPCAVFTPEMMASLAHWVQRLRAGSIVLTTTQKLPPLPPPPPPSSSSSTVAADGAGSADTGSAADGGSRRAARKERSSRARKRPKGPKANRKQCGRLALVDTLQLRYARGKLVVHVYQMPLQ